MGKKENTMLFAVHFISCKHKRVSFITDKESIAIAHVMLMDSNGERIYDYKSIKEGVEYEVPFIS